MKDIAGYEGKYAVDREGNVWSLNNHMHKEPYKLSPRIRKNGYSYLSLCVNGKIKEMMAHRAVAAAYIGNVDGMEVNHINGNRADNRVENLEIVDRSTNLLHGMHVLRSNNAKLTHDQVEWVRHLVAAGVPQADVARQFGVLRQTVNQIIRGTGYANSSIATKY